MTSEAQSAKDFHDDVKKSWAKLLNPESLRKNLIAASVFLTAFEMLVDAIVEQLRSFYSHSWSLGIERVISPEYREKVLSLDKNEVVACATWFKQSGALDDADLVMLKEITDHRNVIAHELPELIGSNEKSISLIHLRNIHLLTTKIDRWWIENVEVPTNPDFDDAMPTKEQLAESQSNAEF